MDSSSISLLATGFENEWRIDVPMRSFQGGASWFFYCRILLMRSFTPGYYSNLISLYKTLGVKFRQADFSYSFSSLWPSRTKWDGPSITTTVIYNGGSGRSGVSKPLSFGHGTAMQKQGYILQLSGSLGVYSLFLWSTVQLLFCYLITLFHAMPFRRPTNIHGLGFKEWTSQVAPKGFLSRLVGMDTAWDKYVRTVLLPLLSAVCTAPNTDVMNHPMEEILGMHRGFSVQAKESNVYRRLYLANAWNTSLRRRRWCI